MENSMIEEEKAAEMNDLVVLEKVQEISPEDLTETMKEEAEKENLATDPEKESPETITVERQFQEVTREKILISQEILIVN